MYLTACLSPHYKSRDSSCMISAVRHRLRCALTLHSLNSSVLNFGTPTCTVSHSLRTKPVARPWVAEDSQGMRWRSAVAVAVAGPALASRCPGCLSLTAYYRRSLAPLGPAATPSCWKDHILCCIYMHALETPSEDIFCWAGDKLRRIPCICI